MLRGTEAAADHGDLRVGEHDAQHCTAQALAHFGELRRVVAGDATFIGSFMQDRHIVAHVACNEDRRRAALQRVAIEQRNRVRIQFERRVPDTGIARLGGNVRITRGQNQLNGAEAEVNMKTGLSRLTAGTNTRVQGLVMPNDASAQTGAGATQPKATGSGKGDKQ